MIPPENSHLIRDRLLFCLLGAGAGLALWGLGEFWNDPSWPGGLFLAVFTCVAVFSTVVLALLGPLAPLRALGGGALLALPVTGLMSLAGARYNDPMQVLDQTPVVFLSLLMIFIATPFVSVGLRDARAWRDYDLLFESAWSMTARYVLAWVFAGVFWALVFLSDALMSLIGISLIEDLLDREWLVFTVTGAVLGLGLTVVYELRATLSPFLFLRLLRLLVPLVLVIVLLFLAALPLRGLGDLFGGVSSAGTLMGVCLASVALVSIAVDRGDEFAVATPGLRLATQGLALTQPALAGLALWAVGLRVSQYGWTPDRLLATGGAVLLAGYALAHAVSVLLPGAWGRGWTGRIRQVNTIMALAVMGFCAAWLTPLLDSGRISVNSQISRFEDGRLGAGDLAYWAMQHDWGKAGQAGLRHLETLTDHPESALLVASVATVREQPDRYRFEQSLIDQRAPEELSQLVALMPVQPPGEGFPVAALSGLPDYRRSQWLEACGRTLPEGGPGCVMIRGRFLPFEGAQAMVLYLDAHERTRAHHLWIGPDQEVRVQEAWAPGATGWPDLPGDAIAAAQAGQFDLRPREGVALHLSGRVLEALP